jgi:hypothetical protein
MVLIERMGIDAFGVDDFALEPRLVDIAGNLLTFAQHLMHPHSRRCRSPGRCAVVVVGPARGDYRCTTLNNVACDRLW